MSLLKGKYLKITIGDVEVDLSWDSSKTSSSLVSVIHAAESSQDSTANDSLLAANLLGGLSGISLKDIKVAKAGKSKVITAGFGASIDLSKLPLIGEAISKIVEVGVNDFQVLISTDAVNATDAKGLNHILPPGADGFPTPINKGIQLLSSFNLGEEKYQIHSASQLENQTASATGKKSANTTPAQPTKISKGIGPFHLQSVGMNFHDGEVTININASIAFGPLVMDFQGLQIRTPFDQFDPSFDLHGLGIDYQSGPVTIGGGFLHDTANGVDEYSGIVTMKLEQLELEAFGSYAKVNGDTSLFIYGLLDYPIGGPPFLFVTGLAAAFGYNRNLVAPDVSEISAYPLVSAAIKDPAASVPATKKKPSAAARTEQMLKSLERYIPPRAGEFFVGLGLKFTSFKIVNSFALLIGKFGKELEFDFLGFSRYVSPAPTDPSPVAVVELELLGRFVPAEGSALVEGQLTPHSFVFNQACHLTGGFAYAFWTSGPHAGDFVISYGGYGSHFSPPSYYPQNVPMLGFRWQVSDDLSVKGGGFWAITPDLVTAGGYLHAVYQSGCFKAWFDLDAYFLIEWKPFHYEAGFSVDFGLSVHVHLLFVSATLHFDLSADLAISGPPFSGTATIDLDVCTIHIDFGSQSKPIPLTWEQFSTSFLPEPDKIININCVSGLVKTVKDEENNEFWVINPKEFSLSATSAIPSNAYELSYLQSDGPGKGTITNDSGDSTISSIGVKPMGVDVGSEGFVSKFIVTLSGYEASSLLVVKEERANVPSALWGDNKSDKLINALNGFLFVPGKPPTPGVTHQVPRQTLAWDLTELENSFSWNELGVFAISDESATDERETLLKELGLAEEISISDKQDLTCYQYAPASGTLTS